MELFCGGKEVSYWQVTMVNEIFKLFLLILKVALLNMFLLRGSLESRK